MSVYYTTMDGSVTSGSDYGSVSGTLTFSPGQTSKTVLVPIYGDTLVEPDEAFGLLLSNPLNLTLGAMPGAYGTILNDDVPAASLAGNVSVSEGNAGATELTFTVTLDQPGQFGATVHIATANGTAEAGPDYQALSGDLQFSPGQTQQTITVLVNGDRLVEGDETLTVTLTVSDGTNLTTGTLVVTVQNVAPTTAVSGPASGVAGQERTFTFAASDPSAPDQAGGFTYQINWGDGSTQTVQGAGSGVDVTHVFTVTGPYTVTVTATDKDSSTGGAASLAVSVVAVELQNGDLIVGGTPGDDQITIQPTDESGTVGVVIKGADQGVFVPTGRVVVFGQAGNDVIVVAALPTGGDPVPLALPVVLLGGDDLLVGGATSHDNDLIFLLALQAEWGRSDADYATRTGHLDGSLPGGLNGTALLNAQTVTDDGSVDSLFGDAGQDWFFAASGGANPDVVNDLEGGEQITLL